MHALCAASCDCGRRHLSVVHPACFAEYEQKTERTIPVVVLDPA